MQLLKTFQLFAAYNQWANQRLYQATAALSDGTYKKDVGAYFGSMHGTLNHVLVGDQVWMKRFTGTGDQAPTLDTILHDDVTSLSKARIREDKRIIDWASQLDEKAISGSFTFTPMTSPEPVTQRLAPCISHFFNHQTHHRGHAHMILSVLGHEPPELDLVYFLRTPEAARWNQ